jgi:hypothetical protein
MHQTSTEYCLAAGCLALTPINLLYHVIARARADSHKKLAAHARARASNTLHR